VKSRRPNIAQIGLLCLLTVIGWGQSSDKFGYFLTGRNTFARVPFELHSNLIIVPVTVNNSDTLRFVLDTGVSTTIITDPEALASQKLKFTRQVKLVGAGDGLSLTASVTIGNTLKMGKMMATFQNLVVLESDILKLSEVVGTPIHGIFGYEVFNNFVVTIDFLNKELLLYSPKNYKYRPYKGDKYPIVIEETKPYTNIMALVENGKTLPLKVMIDTGAGHALLLDKFDNQQIKLPEKTIRTQLGRGLNGTISGSMGRIEKVKFGKYMLNNLIASYPDSLSFGMKLSVNTARQGNIGCELLRRFRVTFNYAEQYMVLKPIRALMKEAFEHDMSGLEIRAKGDKNKNRKYVIDNVTEGSPAWQAGLEENDELIFINDQLTNDMTISDMYRILQKGNGKEVSFFVRRNGQIQYIKFRLKRMI
jgi:Aspartyl protease/PDZ domain